MRGGFVTAALLLQGAFALRADQDPATALAALSTFSEAYQAAIEPALPLFRRRAA